MIERLMFVIAYVMQIAGLTAVVYGGFLLAEFVGWVLLGAASIVLGMALEREVS